MNNLELIPENHGIQLKQAKTKYILDDTVTKDTIIRCGGLRFIKTSRFKRGLKQQLFAKKGV